MPLDLATGIVGLEDDGLWIEWMVITKGLSHERRGREPCLQVGVESEEECLNVVAKESVKIKRLKIQEAGWGWGVNQ